MIEDLQKRFEYHPPKDEATKKNHEQVRYECFMLAREIERSVPAGREQSIAITKIEEAMMWANAGIARAGAAIILLLLMLCASSALAGGPHYARQQAFQHHYQPYVINWFVGAPVRVEALVQKALREDKDWQEFQQFKTWKALAAEAHEPPDLPGPQPARLFACAQCHSGDKPKGGLLLDGSAPLTAAQALKAMRMVQLGEMPPKKKLTAEEAGQVFSDLLDLSQEDK